MADLTKAEVERLFQGLAALDKAGTALQGELEALKQRLAQVEKFGEKIEPHMTFITALKWICGTFAVGGLTALVAAIGAFSAMTVRVENQEKIIAKLEAKMSELDAKLEVRATRSEALAESKAVRIETQTEARLDKVQNRLDRLAEEQAKTHLKIIETLAKTHVTQTSFTVAEGIIVRVGAGELVIRSEDVERKDMAFKVSPEADITIAGKKGRLADLKIGERVRVGTFLDDKGRVTVIATIPTPEPGMRYPPTPAPPAAPAAAPAPPPAASKGKHDGKD